MSIRPSNNSKYVLQGFVTDQQREAATRTDNETVKLLTSLRHSCLSCNHFHVPVKSASSCTRDHGKGGKRKYVHHYNICAKHSDASKILAALIPPEGAA